MRNRSKSYASQLGMEPCLRVDSLPPTRHRSMCMKLYEQCLRGRQRQAFLKADR